MCRVQPVLLLTKPKTIKSFSVNQIKHEKAYVEKGDLYFSFYWQ